MTSRRDRRGAEAKGAVGDSVTALVYSDRAKCVWLMRRQVIVSPVCPPSFLSLSLCLLHQLRCISLWNTINCHVSCCEHGQTTTTKEHPAEKLEKLVQVKRMILHEIVNCGGDNNYKLPHQPRNKDEYGN